MLDNRGMTLIETLFAFSIYVSIIVIILGCINNILNHHQSRHHEYIEYLQEQRVKEQGLWRSSGLSDTLIEVLL